MLKRVYSVISDEKFYKIIQRAKSEGMADKDGRVDLSKLFNLILDSYADGSYTILKACSKPKSGG